MCKIYLYFEKKIIKWCFKNMYKAEKVKKKLTNKLVMHNTFKVSLVTWGTSIRTALCLILKMPPCVALKAKTQVIVWLVLHLIWMSGGELDISVPVLILFLVLWWLLSRAINCHLQPTKKKKKEFQLSTFKDNRQINEQEAGLCNGPPKD